MSNIEPEIKKTGCLAEAPGRDFSLERAVGDITDEDRQIYRELVATELTEKQARTFLEIPRIFPHQKAVLAVHWHPEWIPADLISRRMAGVFPNAENELVIPTQHNQLMEWGDYSGVEVDCYSSGFNRKVQLLLHFKADRVRRGGMFRSMLEHTFKYRSGQLFEFMDSIIDPAFEDIMEAAVAETGANEEVVALARFYTARLRRLMRDHEAETPEIMIKNKLVPDFIRAYKRRHPQSLVERALLLIKAVKEIVKRNFSLDHFFRASEVIEEARSLGGGVVIPHPEQFWPILLADYDVDGWEVWNPQSQNYTKFLIKAMNNQNQIRRPGRRPILVFMGDDTHLGVKIQDPETAEPGKFEREVGWQPAWDDLGIRKTLSLVGAGRQIVIDQYKERLN